MSPAIPTEPPQARRGLDYMTVVFRSAKESHHQDVFDFCRNLVVGISPAVEWEERPRPRFFDEAYASTVGARIELTPLGGNPGKNPGMTSLSLPGAFFYLQDDESLAVSLDRLVNQDGFFRFTRLDFMVTELQPEWDAHRVCLAVRNRELWVAGHRTVREFSERDFAGNCENGLTLYWGSTKSDRQGRTYDKGVQSGWPIPAVRDEVQLRGPWAHTYGRELVNAIKDNLGTIAMTQAIHQLGSGAITQHMMYWQTNGADPKTDIHWKRKAEPASWFRERLKIPAEPLRREVPPPLGVEEAYEHFVRTYGAVVARYLISEGLKTPNDLRGVLLRHVGRCAAKLKSDDWEPLLAQVPEAEEPRLRAELSEILNDLAVEAEHREG